MSKYGYDVNGAPHTAETAEMSTATDCELVRKYENKDKCNDPRCERCWPELEPTLHNASCCPCCATRIGEIHKFLMEFASQMEAMGNNPMVRGLLGGMLPKLGGRNGKDKR